MGKTIKLFLIIVLSLFVLQSCKDPTIDLEWFQFDAEGTYSSDTDTSYLKLNAWVKINQSSVNINPSSSTDATHFQTASVINWRYRIYSGEQLVMEVSEGNIGLLLGEVLLNVAEDQFDYLWVAIESENPISGDLFAGLNPDRAEVEMSVYDSGGNGYSVSNSVPFVFNRN